MKLVFALVALAACSVSAIDNVQYAGYWRPDLLIDQTKAFGEVNPLIVGGNPANDGDFPYQLGLRFNGAFRCGGSIISANWILSAAHCLDGNQAAAGVTWHAGSVNRLSGGVVFSTAEYMLHPQYSRATLDNDVLVARSAQSLTGANIGPVALAVINQSTPDMAPTVVTGWGLTVPGGSLPTILQEVTVPIIPQATCGSIFSITANMICAGAVGLDSCNGDSGGPLTHNGVQVGVVSFGPVQCGNGMPGVYARVASPVIRNWISSTTGV